MTKFPMKVKFVKTKSDKYPCHTTGFTVGKVYDAIALVKYNQYTCFVLANDEGRFVHASVESFAVPDTKNTNDIPNEYEHDMCNAYVSNSIRYRA
jgi:hypothetical protein